MNFQSLKEIALNNPKGRILGHHTLEIERFHNDERNVGNWGGTDCNRDVFTDIKRAIKRLSSMPKAIIGSHDSLKIMMDIDPYSDGRYASRYIDIDEEYAVPRIWESIMPLFYQTLNSLPDKGFIRFDDAADPGIVLLVGTDENDVVYIDTR